MTPRDSHRNFTAFVKKIEDKYLPQVHDVLKSEIEKYLAANGTAANLNDLVTLTDLYPILNNLYSDCGSGYGWSVYKQFAKVKGSGTAHETKGATDTTEQPVTPQSISDQVLRVLRLSLVINVNGISNTFKAAILRKINEGYINGWGYDKTAQELRDIASISRARRIVRTESVKAANLSGITGAKATGLLMNKRWISARDNRVRGNPTGIYPNAEFDHWNVNGEVVGIDAAFTGTGEPMAYPGDPKGAAADIINCRCSVGFMPKRDANGRVIRVTPGVFSGATTQMYAV